MSAAARAIALDLAANRGIPVFPCRPNKTPATPRGFKDATTDPEQIERWFQDGVLIGVPTGRASGITVVDVDPDGHGWYAEHALELHPGCVNKTQRGYHLVYKATIPVQCSAGKVAPGVDVRGEGGYVIWWPAMGLPQTGSLDDLTAFPEWILPRTEEHKASNEGGEKVQEGSRNDHLSRLAFKLRKAGLDVAEIEAALRVANNRRCEPPLPEAEVIGIAERKAKVEPDAESDREPSPEQDVSVVAFSPEQLLAPVPPERELLPGVPAEAYTLVAGGLATAKTTFLHTAILSRATGYDFLNLAPTGITPGPCVLVSYEDADSRIVRRFQVLAQYQYQHVVASYGSKAGDEYLALVARNVRRVTLTGKAGCGIVCRGTSGTILPNGALIDELISKVKAFARSDVLIGLDPLRLAIVGSQSDDDGADVVVHTLNDIASRLPDSGLIVPSHTTKSGAIEPGTSKAAAAYSTSGSALYSQHARSNFLMSRLAGQEARKLFGADEVTAEEIERERIVQLTHARLSHGPEAGARFYAMRNGVLVPVRPNSQELPLAEQARRALAAIQTVILETTKKGHRVSRKALESAVAVGRTRQDRRDYIDECLAQGWLQEAGSTSDKRIEFTVAGRAQLSPSEDGESDRRAA